MTQAQLETRIMQLVKSVFARARLILPRDTGNLQDNAFVLTRTGRWSWKIEIKLAIAPYFVYVNEDPPKPRSKKEEANKGVWDRVCDYIVSEFEKGVAAIQQQIDVMGGIEE